MANNLNGKFSSNANLNTFTSAQLMSQYDSLPREYRDLLKDTFASATIQDTQLRDPQVYVNYFNKIQKESTLATYGADHPQAA